MKKAIFRSFIFTASSLLALGLVVFPENASAVSCLGSCGTLGADGVVTASPVGDPYNWISTENGANWRW